MKKVVITGIGIICSNAENKTDFEKNCFDGKIGIKKCTAFDTDGLLTPYFGQAEGICENERFEDLLKISAEEMMNDSGIDKEYISSLGTKCRMFFGTLMYSADNYYKHSLKKLKGNSDDFLAHMNDFSAKAKEIFGLKGQVTVSSAACASGTTAAGMAFDFIRNGICDMAIVGGADPLSIISAYGFNCLKSLSGGICNPYDEERDGINIGECGVFFLFETLESAKKRGADIYCEVSGYALGNDAYHITSPEPEGLGAYRTMLSAVRDSKVTPNDIDYINGHGTGTKINDSMELKAIQKLMQDKCVSVSSTKAIIGHCMGVSGCAELVSVILSINAGKYIPMPNISKKMNEDFYLSDKSKDMNINYAISNSFAFAGNSASLVVKKYLEE